MKCVTGYLGPKGTFTEEAAGQLQKGTELVPYNLIPDIFRDIESGTICSGVVPTSNTVGGSVLDTVTSLFSFRDIMILGERILHIEHFLMSKGSISQIEVVKSHPNAISQCQNSLRRVLPKARLEVVNSTAEGAEKAAGDPRIGVVGSARLSKIYDLGIHPEEITDSKGNFTRFLNIAKGAGSLSQGNKATVLVAFDSDLERGIDEFRDYLATIGLGISWIESKATSVNNTGLNYIIDLSAKNGANIDIKEISRLAVRWPGLRILGLYAKDINPGSTKLNES